MEQKPNHSSEEVGQEIVAGDLSKPKEFSPEKMEGRSLVSVGLNNSILRLLKTIDDVSASISSDNTKRFDVDNRSGVVQQLALSTKTLIEAATMEETRVRLQSPLGGLSEALQLQQSFAGRPFVPFGGLGRGFGGGGNPFGT